MSCLTDQTVQFHCHCPVKTQWQGRWWLWHRGAGNARPRQLPCPDEQESGIYSHANFSHSVLHMPLYHTFAVIIHTFIYIYHTFLLLYRQKTIYM